MLQAQSGARLAVTDPVTRWEAQHGVRMNPVNVPEVWQDPRGPHVSSPVLPGFDKFYEGHIRTHVSRRGHVRVLTDFPPDGKSYVGLTG